MTTIRKIVTSKIDGDTANNTSINEIRPFGETAFYLDQNFETQKLTLMMFDGQRTHRESKVLAPGVLWGSSADSGDGNNYDTIKLIPDAGLFANGSNQYIVVDPTAGEPGHIHLRAGGTQDSSSADLYLGGERTFVRVSDTYDNVAIGTTGTNANSWVFGSDGLLTLPSGNTTIGNFFGNDAILSSAGTAFGILSQSTGSSVLQWIDDISAPNVVAGIAANGPYGSTGSVQIYTGVIGIPPQHAWTFSDDGKLTLPGGGVIDGSDYDVEIIAGNDGSSTYGHVTLKTNGPNGVNEFYMNSLGELTLPRGGVIQETDVTNEAFGTTTTSLTLVPAGAANGTQRLEIYGTIGGEGDHIHITSGDQNQTDLYLGNDTQYFAVGAMGQVEVRARPGLDSPTTGTSAYAGSPVWIYAGDAGDNGGNTVDGAPGGDVLISAGDASLATGGEVLLFSGNGPDGHGSIKLSTDSGSSYWNFDKDGYLTFPSGGDILFDSSATSRITGVSEVIFADGTTQTTAFTGTSALLDILDTNGIDTNYYLTFVENRVAGQEVRADVDLTFNSWSNTLGVGKISVNSTASSTSTTTGALTVAGGIGIGGNVTLGGSLNFADGTTQTTAYTGTSVSIYLLEAYASETYTLPDSFTEDVCRYSIVNNTVNVSSAWFNTSTYTFTPLKAGYWEITASYDVYRNAEASMVIKKNTSIVASAGSFNAVAQQITKIVYLNGSTDYINIYNFGGAALSRSQYAERSWFQARWAGE